MNRPRAFNNPYHSVKEKTQYEKFRAKLYYEQHRERILEHQRRARQNRITQKRQDKKAPPRMISITAKCPADDEVLKQRLLALIEEWGKAQDKMASTAATIPAAAEAEAAAPSTTTARPQPLPPPSPVHHIHRPVAASPSGS
jgi:hypothetical protein